MIYPVPSDSFYEPPDPPRPPEDMTCEWCNNCEIAPDHASEYGWCRDCGDWVLLDENVLSLGCDAWEL